MKTIKFGLVGCGRISDRHIKAIQAHAGSAQLTALCDIDPAALSQAQKFSPSSKIYSSIQDLLASKSVDVVSVCTPSGLHPEHAMLAASAGCHVVTEKPMAIRIEDGRKMIKHCGDSGKQLFVVLQNRLNPTTQILKQALDQKRLGRIYSVVCNVMWCRPQSYYDQAPWRGTWSMDGGAFMNQASHYVDMLLYLFGPVKKVAALTSTLARKIEAEDTGSVALQWSSGTLGSMNVCMLTYSKNLEGSFTIIGEKGTIRLGGVAGNKIEVWDLADATPEELERVKSGSYEVASVYGNGHEPYYKNVIETLHGDAKPLLDGGEGFRSLELLDAIYRSARSGQLVEL